MCSLLLITCNIPIIQWKMPEQAYVPVIYSSVWSLKLGIQRGLQTQVRSHLRAEFDPLLTKGSEKAFFPVSMVSLTISLRTQKCNFLNFKAFSGLIFLKADFQGSDPTLREASGKTPTNFCSLWVGFCGWKSYSLGFSLNTIYIIRSMHNLTDQNDTV